MNISLPPRSFRSLLGIAICLPLLGTTTAQAQINGSWTGSAAAAMSWGISSNWQGSPSPVPGGAQSIINLTTNTFVTSRTINLDEARVIGILNYGFNGLGVIQANGGSLTFDNGASAAQINYSGAHSQAITAPVTLNSSLNISTVGDTGNTDRTLNGTISAGGADTAKTITYTGAAVGAGRLILNSAISNGAGNRKVSVHMNAANGTLIMRGANTFTGDLRVSAGTVSVETGSGITASALGAGTLKLDGGNLRFNYFNSLNFGRNTEISADTSINVRRSNTGIGLTYTLGTLSVGGNTVDIDNTGGSATSGEDKLVFTTTTLTGNATFNVDTVATSSATLLRLGALNGAFSLTKSGSGIMELNTAAGNYSGTTQLNGGTLRVGNNTALGSGGAVIGGADAATLQINSGITVGNTITYSNTKASVNRVMADSTGVDTGTTGGLRSDLVGGIDTAVALSASTSTGGGAGTLSMRFASTSVAENDANRISDVFSMEFSGTLNRTFVLELSTSVTVPEGSYFGWLDGGEWKLATDGITGGSLAGPHNQSWSAFLAANGGAFNATDMLGAYGFDAATGTGWAVINRTGEFALISPIPEPSTWGLLGLGAGYLILRRRRSNVSIG